MCRVIEAPDNSLPSWSECSLRVHNNGYIEQRVASGGYGPEDDSILATELHKFIHEYSDIDPYRNAWFLHRLERLVSETREIARREILGEKTDPVTLWYEGRKKAGLPTGENR